MNRILVACVCGLTCLAVLAGPAFAQRGGRGGGFGRGGIGHGVHSGFGRASSHGSHTARMAARQRMVRRTERVARSLRNGLPGVAVEAAASYEAEAEMSDEVAVADEATETETEYGVKIVTLKKGAAAHAGLMLGDVILSFNGLETPTFEALRDAVQESGDEAEVIFLNVENGQRESIILHPEDSRIGVGVEPVPVE
jgi:membrane-associated protease RseP (regulator of RpoE activity)